jgi:preprotein translocase subunit SecD
MSPSAATVGVMCVIAAPLAAQLPAPGFAQCPRAEIVEVMPGPSAETRPVAYQNATIHVSRTPISTLADIVAVNFDPAIPWAIALTFRPDAADRMERITGSRPNFPMAFVVDSDAVISVVLQGGFGIGKGGLQVSVDRNQERIKAIYDELSRCVAAQNEK